MAERLSRASGRADRPRPVWSLTLAAAAGWLLTGVARTALGATSLLAQGVSVNQGGSKNYAVEILVTVVLLGLAVWMVCKSSRRV